MLSEYLVLVHVDILVFGEVDYARDISHLRK